MNFTSNWLTHFEKSGLLNSPRYNESIAYFKQFEQKTPYLKMFSIGTSPQGRSIECVVVAKENEFTSNKAKKSNKAIVLIQNGIHAGEIEGKDACMILLRDILITKEKLHLLDNLILLIIPILNVDGHERISQFNRPNQNGPKEMGWRTNSWNLNLNRDYLKADTPEIRAFIKLNLEWLPDFLIDNHTTNGADYQYHVTYGLEKYANIDKDLARWGSKKFLPFVLKEVEKRGFLTAPYIEMKDQILEKGIIDEPLPPRLSTGYMAIQNRQALLVETHSLKPYENRVRSTFAMNVAALEFINPHSKELKDLNTNADKQTIRNIGSGKQNFVLDFKLLDKSELFNFKGFETIQIESEITGNSVIQYTNIPKEFEIPFFNKNEKIVIKSAPKAYVIPKEFSSLIEIIKLHGINVQISNAPKKIKIEKYKFLEYNFAPQPYEGRQRVQVKCKSVFETRVFPTGTFLVLPTQRTARVILHLLEPEAPDSFVSWGFFNAYFERKEYAEAYVMEPLAAKMNDTDSALRQEFEFRLENDEEFRNNPNARLDFFYERSPFFDGQEKVYPLFRMV